MSITRTQPIIKIGTSKGITLPAKDLKKLGLKEGDEVEITYKPLEKVDKHTLEVVEITQKLIKRHKKALDNLSQR